MGIDNSTNAALFAARILGTSDLNVGARVRQYAKDMELLVMNDVENLEREQGTKATANAQQQRSGP
jgi:phosphoribosylcarboxyaminoimidazole (NCAIR) mutase